MKITVAKTSGFCFGVQRAIDIAFKEAEKGKAYTLGPLIHNEQVINKLIEKGIIPVNDISEVPENGRVIIRAHGVEKAICTKIKQKNMDFIDATCPFVKKIHNIVEKYFNLGYNIMIVGDENHPEVLGINGWCEKSALIIKSETELLNADETKKYCLVSQTTFDSATFLKIEKVFNERFKDSILFNTICDATEKRQIEADEISKSVDAMLVIGGRHSSNTMKLKNICEKNCKNTYHIETISELPKAALHIHTLGITAGASTPEWLIKEVIRNMSEEKMNQGEVNFAEELEKSMVTLKTGDVVKGIVNEVTPTSIAIDLDNFKYDGIIPASELSDDPDVNPSDIAKVGDEIEAFVVHISDIDGVVKLSKKKLDFLAGQKAIEEAMESKAILEGKVIEAVGSGVIVLSNGTRVFVPASQASVRYVSDLSTLVGENVKFRVIEINPRRRRVTGSIKSVAAEEREKQLEAFWATAEIGKEYKGVVKSLMDFGAFVDIGGIDGLIHISRLSWSRIKHPSEVLNIGDEVNVTIVDLDKEKNKVSLNYKKDEENPWVIAQEKFNIGDVVSVRIVRMVDFGAFAELLPTVDGLIHVSQIAKERIEKPSSVLKINQVVDAKIVDINWDEKKISLSMKQLILDEEEAVEEVPVVEEVAEEAVEEAPVEE